MAAADLAEAKLQEATRKALGHFISQAVCGTFVAMIRMHSMMSVEDDDSLQQTALQLFVHYVNESYHSCFNRSDKVLNELLDPIQQPKKLVGICLFHWLFSLGRHLLTMIKYRTFQVFVEQGPDVSRKFLKAMFDEQCTQILSKVTFGCSACRDEYDPNKDFISTRPADSSSQAEASSSK
jgi:hypothetical protein